MTFYALDTNIISYFLKNDPVIVQKINEEKEYPFTRDKGCGQLTKVKISSMIEK
jgi:hypothetical protein